MLAPAAFAQGFMNAYDSWAASHGHALIVDIACRKDGERYRCGVMTEGAGKYGCYEGALLGVLHGRYHIWALGRAVPCGALAAAPSKPNPLAA